MNNEQFNEDEAVKNLINESLGLKIDEVKTNYNEINLNVLNQKREECTPEYLIQVLGKTVKKDDNNKLIVFLCQLLAYTEDSQINISFNAPSSSGKSYLALEIADFFPQTDVIKLGYASPTSFFHTVSTYDKERKGYIVDLHRKILIFLDMPHSLLLQHLRPLLSHDEKEILVKITDKSGKGGIKTKDVYIKGFPSVLFCSASFNLDEQEQTRFILLSPETNQEKIRESILEKIKKETDKEKYKQALSEDPLRQELKERITAIKTAKIKKIKLGNQNLLIEMFTQRHKNLKPRHQRDISRIISFIKAFAILNLWTREFDGDALITNERDLKNAFRVWDEISMPQELGVAPYILNLYKEVIIPLFEEKNKVGLSRKDIIKKHYDVYGRYIADWQLRQEILPQMSVAGLIYEEQDTTDKRKILIYPQLTLTISHDQNNSELEGGVDIINEVFGEYLNEK